MNRSRLAAELMPKVPLSSLGRVASMQLEQLRLAVDAGDSDAVLEIAAEVTFTMHRIVGQLDGNLDELVADVGNCQTAAAERAMAIADAAEKGAL